MDLRGNEGTPLISDKTIRVSFPRDYPAYVAYAASARALPRFQVPHASRLTLTATCLSSKRATEQGMPAERIDRHGLGSLQQTASGRIQLSLRRRPSAESRCTGMSSVVPERSDSQNRGLSRSPRQRGPAPTEFWGCTST